MQGGSIRRHYQVRYFWQGNGQAPSFRPRRLCGQLRLSRRCSVTKHPSQQRFLPDDDVAFVELPRLRQAPVAKKVYHVLSSRSWTRDRSKSLNVRVTGWGTINARQANIASQDFTVLGGSLSDMRRTLRRSGTLWRRGAPVIGWNDPCGARIHRIRKGTATLADYSDVFKRNVEESRPADFSHGA
ncbi:hypothetical protein MZK49_30965 [Ensifer sesbaniae]|uniref:carboxyl transferase domain-containing protein n=1 Tax=Ensifer sesbaniae TaxID=1214071 RepID=UPI001FECA109|nr:carboxyl transferase domain-containing protein [Ensifer sesbaniae]MCK3781079.1 hypothetical protein [Ensifer sesbaniae]NRQ16496.1 Propionyl-CoA carboxylase beta chain [Ensifer sesbaniae]